MRYVNICEVCEEIFAGGDAPKNNMSFTKTAKHTVPIYSNGEVESGLYGFTNKARVFKPSITVSARGTIGYTVIRKEPFVPIVRLITITPKTDLIDINFLYYAMRNYKFNYSGTSIPQLTVPVIKKYSFPLPCLEEQKKISKQMRKIESIIKRKKEKLILIDDLVKSRFVELFGDPAINQKNYPIKYLPEIAKYWNGLTYKPDDVAEKGTIVLRSSNIQNASLDFEDTVRVSCKIGEKKFVQNNDILMCSRNGSARLVGKVALIKNVIEPMSFGAFMMIIRSEYYPYLMTYFQLPAFRAQITTGATSTINQVTGKMLDAVKLPVPNISIVKEFALFVEQIDKLKLSIQKSLDETQKLFDSLMQEYFG